MDLDVIFHELTNERVKLALSSLMSTTSTKPPGKRGRPKSHHRSMEHPAKKVKPMIYNQIVLSPQIAQAESIVLATSGLTSKQIVSLFSLSLLR